VLKGDVNLPINQPTFTSYHALQDGDCIMTIDYCDVTSSYVY